MTPYTSYQLQSDVDAINAHVSKLLELAALDGYGIVSQVQEAVTQDQLAVAFDTTLNRITVTPGTFVTPAGQVFSIDSHVSDLLWPSDPLLYVALYSSIASTEGQSTYETTETLYTLPQYFMAVVNHDDLVAMGNTAIVLAVLRRSPELDEIDVTNLVTPQNRHVFSMLDLEHEALGAEVGDDQNPHGTGLDQVQIAGVSLLRQMHKTGFVLSAVDGAAGVPGNRVVRNMANLAQQDPIGRYVAPGSFYILLDAYPTQMPRVLSNTSGSEVPFTWQPGTNVFDFGPTDPGPITIDFFEVPDAEIQGSDVGVVTRFRRVSSGALISDGSIVYAGDASVDVSAYSGTALNLDVVVDNTGTYQVVPEMIGTLIPSASKVPTTSFPYTMQNTSQIAFGVTNSELYGRVSPPLGRLDVANSLFVGRYQFMYTIAVPEVRSVLQDPGSWVRLFTDTGFGSYSVSVSAAGGILTRNKRTVDSRYYNIVAGVLYLEARAYSEKHTYEYVIPANESKRFGRGFTEGKGTKPKPEGRAASATLTLLANLEAGDAVSVQFEPANPAIRKVYGTDFTGTNIVETAQALRDALLADALFATKATASAVNGVLTLVPNVLGEPGNAYTLTVAGTNMSTKVSVKSFQGGAAYTPNIIDVAGCMLNIHQPNQNFPYGTRIRVYLTDNLDESGDVNKYYSIVDIPFTAAHSYSVTLTQDQAAAINTAVVGYDLTKQFKVTIAVQGTDGNGQSVSDSVVLAENTIFEVDRFGDPYQFVTTKAAYASVTGMVATESVNVGAAKIVALGQALSRNSSKSRVAEISTNKERVLTVHDTRLMQPASLTTNPSTQSSALYFGLALSKVS